MLIELHFVLSMKIYESLYLVVLAKVRSFRQILLFQVKAVNSVFFFMYALLDIYFLVDKIDLWPLFFLFFFWKGTTYVLKSFRGNTWKKSKKKGNSKLLFCFYFPAYDMSLNSLKHQNEESYTNGQLEEPPRWHFLCLYPIETESEGKLRLKWSDPVKCRGGEPTERASVL